MKKILILLFFGCICSANLFAQRTGLYIYTDEAIASKGLLSTYKENYDSPFPSYSISNQNMLMLSVGVGYLFNESLGIEVDLTQEQTSLMKEQENTSYSYNTITVLSFGLYVPVQLTQNIYWKVSLSYRRLNITPGSDKYHDIYVEPAVFEYRTNKRHWGFQLSLLSFEVMTDVKDFKAEDSSYTAFDPDMSKGSATMGLGMNVCSFRLSYYF